MIHERFTSRAIRLPAATLAVSILVATVSGRATAGDFALEIAGVANDQGGVFIAIHAAESAAGFPNDNRARYRFRIPAAVDRVQIAIPDVAPGQYAIAAFHDENGNGELDVNQVGVPIEGYGFSNNAAANPGPASFADAAFELGESPAAVRVKLSY